MADFWNSLIGHSNAQSKPFSENPEYEKWRYQYGGDPAGAANERANLANRQAAVEERTAPQMQAASMQGAQLDQTAANQTRDIQMGSLAGLSAAANGAAPSAAENLAQRGMDRAARGQVSAAGTTRGGPGAQSSAYRYASQNAAQQRADAIQGSQAARADEMATARGQLASASSAVRGADLNAASTNAQLLQDTAKTNSGYQQDASKTNVLSQNQNRALNDQRANQYELLQNKVASDQLDANLHQQDIMAGNRRAADDLNTRTNVHNADRNWEVFKGIAGGAAGVATAALPLLSDPATKVPIFGSLAGLGLGGGGGSPASGPAQSSFEVLSGGGEDVAASGKRMSDYATRFGRNPTQTADGPDALGPMMSDEDTKEPAQTWGEDEDRSSPTFRSWLGRSAKGAPVDGETRGAITGGGGVKSRKEVIDDLIGEDVNARPYDRDPEVSKGVAGAPRGYANGRSAPEEDKVSWSKPDTWGSKKQGKEEPADTSGQAPGTDDWNRYGAGAKKDGETDWAHGGSDMKPEGRPGVFETLFRGMVSGASGQPLGAPPAPPAAPRDITTSDPAAKRAAFEAGFQEGANRAKGRAGERPKGAGKPLDEGEELVVTKEGEPEIRQHSTPTSRFISKDEIPPDTIAIDMNRPDPFIRSAAAQAKGEGRALAEGGNGSAFIPSPPAATPPAPSAADRARAFARDIVRSDEKTKDGFARPSDESMARAMRSMDPAAYAYKPEYSPPDQKPGEVNIGPMANEMAKDPVARTAIVRDDDSGMLAIDKTKAEKVIMGSLAALQHQIDSLEGDVPRAERAKKQRRRGGSSANA